MRWDVLIQDLSDRFEYLSRQDDADMVPDLVRAERAGITLAHRLSGSLKREVAVTVTGGSAVSGVLEQVGGDWLLITDQGPAGRSSVIPLDHIQSVRGLTAHADQSAGSSRGEINLLAVLRQLAQSRLPVTLIFDVTSVSGHMVAVGKDWLDLRSQERPEQITTYSIDRLEVITNRAIHALR